MKGLRGTGIGVALVLGSLLSGGAHAQTSATRASSFAYDSASGLLTQEVVEPNTTALRLQTDYTYDAFGNKISATVSGVDIASRTASSTYDAKGQFVLSSTNQLGQSESWQYDARFGKPTSHTGPNGLTTTWSYDSFGRKTLEVRADGTQTKWTYQFCSGVNGGTATCITGAVYQVQSTPLAADGTTPNGPYILVYFDTLDRELARDTLGFDGTSLIRTSTQYDSLGRVQKKSQPYFVSGGTPQWTTFAYDTLGRVVTQTAPDNTTTQHAYHGLTTSGTNALNQAQTITKNSQGKVVAVTDANGKVTSYVYDPFGNLIQTIDAVGNVVSATYDTRGRKIASNDPDMGAWSYSYDTLGQLLSQTDAKNQTTTMSYDGLGRLTQRVEVDMTCVWVYDTATNGIGKLASASITAGPSNGYQRSFTYDALGRPTQVATTISGSVYTIAGSYDANSRLSTVTYPSGFAAKYVYTALGDTSQVTDSAGTPFWTANARDALQHLTQQTAGNGITTIQSFDAQTNRLMSINAGSGNAVASFSYSYDLLGNVLSRADANTSLSESFTYDPLNRLTSATVSLTPTPLVKTFSYDPIGNLLSKTDVGTYTYPPAGSAQPHAVTNIAGGAINTTFTYDPNGNQVSGLGRDIVYTSFNKPASITQGSRTISFSHDVDHQRFQQISPEGTTTYLDGFGVHVELFSAGQVQWNEYISVGKLMIAVRFNNVTAGTVSMRYFHTDHLGSIAVITNETGAVVERTSYDAWGKRRFANGADDTTGSLTSQTTRGFTGQETLADVGLVHLNGRVYDPLIGRMMSADPTVPDAMNGQAWNRYAYVINNPLGLTDPTGYSFWSAIGSFFSHLFAPIKNFLLRNPIVGQIATAISAAICGPCAAITSFAVAGITTGKFGLALKAGALTLGTQMLFAGIGTIADQIASSSGAFASDLFNIGAKAAVGCGAAAASGGQCGPGAAAAAASAAISSVTAPLGLPSPVALLVNAAAGGAASVAGGGKFANGAVTAAFAYAAGNFGGAEDGPFSNHAPGSLGMRPLTDGEIAVAKTEFPDLNTDPIRIIYDHPGQTAITPNNMMHFPFNSCQDFSSCSTQELGWFVHETTHVWQHQNGISPGWGRIASDERFMNGGYLPIGQYRQFPSPDGLSTEKAADWHQWHYLCGRGLIKTGC